MIDLKDSNIKRKMEKLFFQKKDLHGGEDRIKTTIRFGFNFDREVVDEVYDLIYKFETFEDFIESLEPKKKISSELKRIKKIAVMEFTELRGYMWTGEFTYEPEVVEVDFWDEVAEVLNMDSSELMEMLEEGCEVDNLQEAKELVSSFTEKVIFVDENGNEKEGRILSSERKTLTKEISVEIEGVKIINTTPHTINLLSEKTGKEYVVEPCGFVLNATPVEEILQSEPVNLVKTAFIGNEEGHNFIDSIPTDTIIVGSMIACQAYDRVCAMTPAKGFERVPPAQKKMNLFKFTK